jgi:Na+-translocating ferredoxin:NAD+ oxidoreductase RnfG subunit
MHSKSLGFLLAAPAALVAYSSAFAVDYLTLPQAQQAIFPDADQFVEAPVDLTDEQRKAIEQKAKVRQRAKRQAVWRAEKGGAPIGWFIVDEVIGKHEFITYSVGLTLDGKVRGVEILVYRETHGYQIREPQWRQNFTGKTLADPFKLDNDIPNISGATLSCRNVTDGIKRLLALQQLVLSPSK